MSVLVASARGGVIADAGKGAKHQPLRGPTSTRQTPSYFFFVPLGSALQGGTLGVAYSVTIIVEGGTAPYTFAITSGALPGGLSLNGATGVISGTPTAGGTPTFQITATDANGITGSASFTITIAAPAAGGNFNYAF